MVINNDNEYGTDRDWDTENRKNMKWIVGLTSGSPCFEYGYKYGVVVGRNHMIDPGSNQIISFFNLHVKLKPLLR